MKPKERAARFNALSEMEKLALKKLSYTWDNMNARCRNKSRSNYHRYGGRGISIEFCSKKAFRDSMLPSLIAAMTRNKGEQVSIDRVDNDGNYSLDNCRWITLSENSSKDNKGKPKGSAHKAAMSKERRGKPQTPARAKQLEDAHKAQEKRIAKLQAGVVIHIYSSVIAAAKENKLHASNIARVASEVNPKWVSSGGYGWKYV